MNSCLECLVSKKESSPTSIPSSKIRWICKLSSYCGCLNFCASLSRERKRVFKITLFYSTPLIHQSIKSQLFSCHQFQTIEHKWYKNNECDLLLKQVTCILTWHTRSSLVMDNDDCVFPTEPFAPRIWNFGMHSAKKF